MASGKGGVGKTWFSISLAHALSQQGCHVLLFDGDLGLANIDIQLGLTPPTDLTTVLAGKSRLEQAVFACPQTNFDVIAGQSGNAPLASLRPAALENLLADLAQMPYDFVVLDLGAGIDHAVRRMAAWSDTLYVLVTDEPTSLTDAYAVLKIYSQDCPRRRARVVVNQAATRIGGHRSFTTLSRACEHFLGHSPELAGLIRRDDHVRDAIRRQTPLLTRYPTTHAAEDVCAIARGLLANLA